MLSSYSGFPHKLHLKIIKITSLMSNDSLNLCLMVSGAFKGFEKDVDGASGFGVPRLSVPHEDGP